MHITVVEGMMMLQRWFCVRCFLSSLQRSYYTGRAMQHGPDRTLDFYDRNAECAADSMDSEVIRSESWIMLSAAAYSEPNPSALSPLSRDVAKRRAMTLDFRRLSRRIIR